ncbi:MAG: hypothetical protein H6595_10790 [Flavobacteriales bacterium]|nr:hypothetical protein [Flavobacteriales bacterium]MCB9167948.1 hypothetical protein [Flavobacteriales bacterium]
MRLHLLAGTLIPLAVSGQSITWSWLNEPCAMMLSCDTGCTACNVPSNESPQFMGTNVAMIGLDVCPFPVQVNDNVLLTYGWSDAPQPGHRVVLSGIALVPVHIDSLFVRGIGMAAGPHRIRVDLAMNNGTPVPMADQELVEGSSTLLLDDLGTVQADETMVFGTFQITLTAYQGSAGAWGLDEVRVVGSPASLSTSVPEGLQATGTTSAIPECDLLGRAVRSMAPGPRLHAGAIRMQVR